VFLTGRKKKKPNHYGQAFYVFLLLLQFCRSNNLFQILYESCTDENQRKPPLLTIRCMSLLCFSFYVLDTVGVKIF